MTHRTQAQKQSEVQSLAYSSRASSAKVELGLIRNSILASITGSRNPSTWAIICYLVRAVPKSWMGSKAARIMCLQQINALFLKDGPTQFKILTDTEKILSL